ncbi:MAG: helix-turn-helix transcriptional regulator [Clostridia bacterium]|nr:helix-turn-helix transcriptional regulator [Clostridia bacterium]
MAEKKVGALVKEARTAAGLTQEKLARAAGEGLSAADISKCERGETDLTTAQLKKIAVACGVTQSSLVNAPKNQKTAAVKTGTSKTAAKTTAAKTTAGKTAAKATAAKTITAKTTTKKAAAKTTTAKATAAKTNTAKTTTPAGANTSMKVTATEKKLVEAYREAPADLKKAALKVLKGEYGDTINKLLGASSAAGATAADGIGGVLGDLLGGLLNGK